MSTPAAAVFGWPDYRSIHDLSISDAERGWRDAEVAPDKRDARV